MNYEEIMLYAEVNCNKEQIEMWRYLAKSFKNISEEAFNFANEIIECTNADFTKEVGEKLLKIMKCFEIFGKEKSVIYKGMTAFDNDYPDFIVDFIVCTAAKPLTDSDKAQFQVKDNLKKRFFYALFLDQAYDAGTYAKNSYEVYPFPDFSLKSPEDCLFIVFKR